MIITVKEHRWTDVECYPDGSLKSSKRLPTGKEWDIDIPLEAISDDIKYDWDLLMMRLRETLSDAAMNFRGGGR